MLTLRDLELRINFFAGEEKYITSRLARPPFLFPPNRRVHTLPLKTIRAPISEQSPITSSTTQIFITTTHSTLASIIHSSLFTAKTPFFHTRHRRVVSSLIASFSYNLFVDSLPLTFHIFHNDSTQPTYPQHRQRKLHSSPC